MAERSWVSSAMALAMAAEILWICLTAGELAKPRAVSAEPRSASSCESQRYTFEH